MSGLSAAGLFSISEYLEEVVVGHNSAALPTGSGEQKYDLSFKVYLCILIPLLFNLGVAN